MTRPSIALANDDRAFFEMMAAFLGEEVYETGILICAQNVRFSKPFDIEDLLSMVRRYAPLSK